VEVYLHPSTFLRGVVLTEAQGRIYITVLSYFVLMFFFLLPAYYFSLSYSFCHVSILPLFFSFLLPFCMSLLFLFARRITATLVSGRNGFSGEALL
jgi:hypothetical protein